jgi:hypothetical protein
MLEADHLVLRYLDISYTIIRILLDAGNILGCDNVDIYIYIGLGGGSVFLVLRVNIYNMNMLVVLYYF